MADALLRTLIFCGFAVTALFLASYIVTLGERVATLEDRVSNSIMVPRPVDIIINRTKRGDDSK